MPVIGGDMRTRACVDRLVEGHLVPAALRRATCPLEKTGRPRNASGGSSSGVLAGLCRASSLAAVLGNHLNVRHLDGTASRGAG